MSRLFHYAVKQHIGLGNPDSVPYRRGQMKNSYPFFHRYRKQLLLIAVAVQEPDYTYINPKTSQHFTVKALYHFANNYLGAKLIFWNVQQPQFSQQLIPMLNKKHVSIIH